MCRFCTQHGDGKIWYLRAESYAADLSSDLERERREYLSHFISDFDHTRSMGIAAGDTLRRLPRPLHMLGSRWISHNMQRDHFGQPVPLEDIDRILDITTSVVRLPCLCRTQAGRTPEGVCLAVTTRPIDGLLSDAFGANPSFADGPDVSRFDRLTKAQAMDLLRACETRGLMHSVWTFKSPWIGAICNCDLPSGCMAMRLTLDYGIKVMWKGEYVVRMDRSLCNGCAACAGICPFGAITHDRERRTVNVNADACYGCGTCRAACRNGALFLAERRPLIGEGITPAVAW